MVPNDINHVYIWFKTFIIQCDLDFHSMNPFFIVTIIRQVALVLLSVSQKLLVTSDSTEFVCVNA